MSDITFSFDYIYLFVVIGSFWVSTILYTLFPITHWIVLILATVITAALFFGDFEGFSGFNKSDSELSHVQNKPVSKWQNQVNYQLDCHNTPEGFYDLNGELNICISKP